MTATDERTGTEDGTGGTCALLETPSVSRNRPVSAW